MKAAAAGRPVRVNFFPRLRRVREDKRGHSLLARESDDSLPPDRVPECGPGLDYLIEVFSFTEMLGKVFTGSGECATIDWSFLYLSMPAWALIWFVLLGTIFAIGGLRR